MYNRLGGLAVIALDLQAESHGFEPRSGRENFQTISTPSSVTPALVHLAQTNTTCPDMLWVEYKVDIEASGVRQTHAHNAYAASSMCPGCAERS